MKLLTNFKEVEDARRALVELLEAHGEWLFCAEERAGAGVELRRGEWDLRASSGSLLLSFWGESGARVWRISAWELRGEKLLLEATRRMGAERATLELVPRASASSLKETVIAARRAACERMASLVCETLGRAKVEQARLSAGARRGEPGRYARILLRHGRTHVAATGPVVPLGAEEADAFLASALLWFARLERKPGDRRPRRLLLIAPRKLCEATSERLALLREELQHAVALHELDEENRALASVRVPELEELLRASPPPLFRSKQAAESELAARVVALAPGAIDVVRARHGQTLRFHGLAFARVRRVMNSERLWFGAGRAQQRRLLDESNWPELSKLLEELAEHRRADAGDRRHALYTGAPESWLESILRRDITRLDPGLIISPLHAQFRATRHASGGSRPIDLLALRRDGRLVVIELKVSEDAALPLQGADYWRRISAHHRAGHVKRARLFGDAEISDDPPLVYLVAPLLRFHRAFQTLARCITPEIETYRFEGHKVRGIPPLQEKEDAMRLLTAHLRRTLLPTLILSLVISLLAAPAMLSLRHAQTPSASPAEATQHAPSAEARETYGRIPLSFETNQGQTDGSVNFLARGAGYTLFLKPAEAVFVLTRHEGDESAKRSVQKQSDNNARLTRVLRMKLVGADANATVAGAEELAGKVNYFVGNDPAQWRTSVPAYGRVRYTDVYPGIDMVYYGNQRQLEYDFRIAPGADARTVSLQFDGADKVALDAGGDLLLTLGESVIRQPKPVVYQEVAGERRAIEGGYVVREGGRVGFAVGAYDAERPLVIDPVLVYSTYLGGSGGDQGLDIAVDPAGNAYITGFTNSTDFPTVNPIQSTNGSFQDGFVTKLNAAGNAFVYSTYLGGNGFDQARGIAVDSAGNAYVTGFTNSDNFPTANAFDATIGANGDDAFVTKLNAAGNALVYSTYLGGSDSAEFGEDIAVDSSGNAYVTGSTFSTDFPVVNAIQSTFGGFTDAFVSKLNAAGSALVYSTYLGGSEAEIGEGIAVDSAGAVYLTGDTSSTNFPTANAVQATNGGGQDAFVLKLNAAGSALVYSTYLGGSVQDDGEAIAPDSAGNAYVTGNTFSTNFPTANAIQPANGGTTITQDAFVTKFNPTGSALVYSTYLGGTGGEIGFGIAVDSSGNAYIGGATGSFTSFPTANAIQCSTGGGQDAFVTKLNAAGNAFIYSTYLGGTGTDNGRGIALDSANNVYLGGFTRSSNFPVVNAAQSAFGGDATIFGDAFMAKISDTSTAPVSALQFTQTAPSVQEDVTFLTLTVQRTGDTSGPVTVDYSTADGTASERSDYTTALGTLRFAAGETAKDIVLLINEDSRVEGNETFTVNLSNPTGGATLSCLTATATVQITDDATEPATNPIDDAPIFVGQHYHDFLNRQSDTPGMTFWTSQITSCGTDGGCRDFKRTNVSQAFFLSIEFQQTGYLVYRIYKETFTDSPSRPRGMPRYREFLRDTQEVQRGVVIGQPGADQLLAANRLDFARRWVQTPEFIAQFPVSMTAAQFVDKLFLNSETTPTQAERDAAIAAFGSGGVEGRAAALLNVADSGSVYNRQYNPAFVLMQYIGYLRRNPNDAPDTNYAGFDFWLGKMNQFSLPGEDVRNEQVARARVQRAEMVRAFIISGEYRGRFGQP
ncbi:MAG: SBBP repeat-containing protein [Acidobacteria bacterium]|nr:SBBP repeat-containing protein [Acidobacteriota bacterium]